MSHQREETFSFDEWLRGLGIKCACCDAPITLALLRKLVSEIPCMSARANNVLYHLGLRTVGDLVVMSEKQLLATVNLGKITVAEIKAALAEIGLRLGMKLSGWPPAQIEQIQRALEEPY